MGKFVKQWDDNYKSTIEQNWDREKITIKRNGKNINLYDMIQENKGDSDIYECLQKYGTLQPITLDYPGFYAEFEQTMTIKDSLELQNKIQDLFDGLPKEERAKFNNSVHQFKDQGLEYYKKLIMEKKYAEINQQTNTGNSNQTSTTTEQHDK